MGVKDNSHSKQQRLQIALLHKHTFVFLFYLNSNKKKIEKVCICNLHWSSSPSAFKWKYETAVKKNMNGRAAEEWEEGWLQQWLQLKRCEEEEVQNMVFHKIISSFQTVFPHLK